MPNQTIVVHVRDAIPTAGRCLTSSEARQIRRYAPSLTANARGSWTIHTHHSNPDLVEIHWGCKDGSGASWNANRGEFEVPNLDAMEVEELRFFYKEHERGANARQLFKDGGKGTMRAASDLSHYAINKGTAIQCRKNGKIEEAIKYEQICEKIYNDLPSFARW